MSPGRTPAPSPAPARDLVYRRSSAAKEEGREDGREKWKFWKRDAPEVKRLGMTELGIFAYEKEMPRLLREMLEKKGIVHLDGMISSLAQALDSNTDTQSAYLCDENVWQVFKLPREGQFCGYRNIQTIASYVLSTAYPGHEHLPDGVVPSVFAIQDGVERAWSLGFNPEGRVETGGIRGTRKHIGTPEAEAFLRSLGIPCEIRVFHDSDGRRACDRVHEFVAGYFRNGYVGPSTAKVRRTRLPPIYFQTPKHSMTIVGCETVPDGSMNILVFDPKFSDPEELRSAFTRIPKKGARRRTSEALRFYRRDINYLRRFSDYEMLWYASPPLLSPAMQNRRRRPPSALGGLRTVH